MSDLVRLSNGRINRQATVLEAARTHFKDFPFTALDICEALGKQGYVVTHTQVNLSLKLLKQYKLGIGRDPEGMFIVCEPGEKDDQES